MKQFCIIANREKDENLNITNWMSEYLTSKGMKVFIANEVETEEGIYTDATTIPKDTECAIVLGGDGTLLQAAHDLLSLRIPLIGINLGTLGFLAETEKLNVQEALNSLFSDDYRIEERMMLNACVLQNQDKAIVDKSYSPALNDIVITRSGFSRIIGVSIYVNGALVNDYRGDGVIISTPTGSTGYNLSSGGPVVKPDTSLMIVTPICAHALNSRSIILSPLDKVKVKISKSKKTQEEEAIATFDGRQAILLQAEDEIDIMKSKEETQLVKINQKCFFEILRKKIGQGGDSE